MPMAMLKAVPAVRVKLAALAVVRFQNTPSKNTVVIGGAIKLNTDWKILKRFRSLMESMATHITIESTAPRSMTTRPT